MPEIKLTQKELHHLRSYCEYELKEAHRYIKQLKSIIRKFETADNPTVVKPLLASQEKAMTSGKKTRQPNNATIEAPAKPVAAKPEGPFPGNPITEELQIPTPGIPVPEKPSPVAPSKPKRKRKSNYRPQGVFLTKMSKPIPKLPEDDIGLPYGSKNTHII